VLQKAGETGPHVLIPVRMPCEEDVVSLVHQNDYRRRYARKKNGGTGLAAKSEFGWVSRQRSSASGTKTGGMMPVEQTQSPGGGRHESPAGGIVRSEHSSEPHPDAGFVGLMRRS